MRPNDPAAHVILHDAATRLESAGWDATIDGYRLGRKIRKWEVAGAIWSALAMYARPEDLAAGARVLTATLVDLAGAP